MQKMQWDGLLTVSEFAELSGITRSNLLYYDEIGLLKPDYRAENNYRLYSPSQLELINAILLLRGMGLPLDAVKEHILNRTPERTLELFDAQIRTLSAKIDDLLQLKESMEQYVETISLHKYIKAPLFTLEVRRAETIFMGQLCASAPNLDATCLNLFVKQCREIGINYTAQMGQIVFMKSVLTGKWDAPGCMYAKTRRGTDSIKGGLFASLFELSQDYLADNHAYYEKFMQLVCDNELELCGNIYIEYPLDEISENDPKKHLMKIFSPVRQK
ncbi:MAG: MerR family transcriptional regulator [Synergistaceae bacterium]|nr:MerR family transcriptional regulator [Synergistaceae bacterium]